MPEVLVRSVMSPYEGVNTRNRVDSELTEESLANVGMYQVSIFWICGRC